MGEGLRKTQDSLIKFLVLIVLLTILVNTYLYTNYDDEGSIELWNYRDTLEKKRFTNPTIPQIVHPVVHKNSFTTNNSSLRNDHSKVIQPIPLVNQTSTKMIHPAVLFLNNTGDHHHMPPTSKNHIDIDEMTDKTLVRQVLRKAGVDISPEIEAVIPTWSEVTSLYGAKPKIMGLETCEAFRKSVPVSDAMIGPAGIFNTGTNLLASILANQCTMPDRDEGSKASRGMLWQVPWGKHNPISLRLKHHTNKQGDIIQTNVLPVVTIKDPYHWMGSMCRHSYAANWFHSDKHCPNLVANEVDLGHRGIGRHDMNKPIEVKVRFQPTVVPNYESLAGLWNDWYGDYIAVDSFPRLIIRFEDLLFHLEEVISEVCKCAGGVPHEDMALSSASAKGNGGSHSGSNGLLSAIKRYGHKDRRLEGMTKEDLDYAKRVLKADMMEAFGYSYPD